LFRLDEGRLPEAFQRMEPEAAPARGARNPASGRSGAPRFGYYDPKRRQLRQRRQWFPTACGSESDRRRNNAFGQGRTSPARRTASNAWTHVVSPRGRIGVRTAPKRLRKVSKRGSAKDAAVERREASAQRVGAERLAKVFRAYCRRYPRRRVRSRCGAHRTGASRRFRLPSLTARLTPCGGGALATRAV